MEHIKAVYEAANIELPDTIIQDDAIKGDIARQEEEMEKLLKEA